MLKFIFEVAVANMISDAITAPTGKQIEAEQWRQWQIEKEKLIRAKAAAMLSDLIRSQNMTPDQVVQAHRIANEEIDKALLTMADQQPPIYVAPPSNNAADILGRFVGGVVIGIIILVVLLAFAMSAKAAPYTSVAMAICMYSSDPNWASANGCQFPENGMTYYETAEQCQRIADQSNQQPVREVTTFKRTLVCVQKTVNSWEPVK
jgi:hypothetical protein